MSVDDDDSISELEDLLDNHNYYSVYPHNKKLFCNHITLFFYCIIQTHSFLTRVTPPPGFDTLPATFFKYGYNKTLTNLPLENFLIVYYLIFW
jgi:hypothetical protein